MTYLTRYSSAVLAILLIVACGHAANSVMTVPANSPQFVVSLPANPTTGYQWGVTEYDTSQLVLVSGVYQAPQTKLVGAGGTMVFTFKPIAGKPYPASTLIRFEYARPWEKTGGTEKTMEVQFK